MRAARLLVLAVGALVALAASVSSRVGAAAQDARVTWLIVVDDLHLDFRNTGHIRTLLRSIALELIRDGDAFVLRSPGPSPSIELTTDRSQLDAAISRVAGHALPPDAILLSSQADERLDEVRHRESLAGSVATQLLYADRSSAERRQAMLYISNGYHLEPPDAKIAAFASAAQQSHVTVFAMNARVLPGAPAVPAPGDPARWASYRAAMLKSLRAIAEPTGGFAVLDEADFADALPRISRRMR